MQASTKFGGFRTDSAEGHGLPDDAPELGRENEGEPSFGGPRPMRWCGLPACLGAQRPRPPGL
jgi:hypothetical protein